jgi:hypothetical protein
MTTQSLQYPNRADTLALLRAREQSRASEQAPARSGGVAASSRTDAPVCMSQPPHAPR